MKQLSFVIIVLWALVSANPINASDPALDSEIQERLRVRLETAFISDSLEVAGEKIHARDTLIRIYSQRAYEPLWVGANGASSGAAAFQDWLSSEPAKHGLNPAHYHLDPIQNIAGKDSAGALVDLELALSDAFLIVGSHLLAGRINPTTLDPEWHALRRERDLGSVLLESVALANPGEGLNQLLPRDPGYLALTRQLSRLRSIALAGGWPNVPDGATLHPGDVDERVPALAARLGVATPNYLQNSGLFDEDLETAVIAFQARHGLNQDGVVGRNTFAALNVSVEARIEQIVVNLERWRWLPETLGDRYVLVNIANFGLDVVQDREPVFSMRVIVGKTYRRTPVFSGKISYLVLNPAWEVPYRIAVLDKLPLIQEDPGYLEQNGYRVLKGWGADELLIDPGSVDWSALSRTDFPYRLRQMPGPQNALGRIKFMFPNEFAVYLHDTPTRELFSQAVRIFSSGCIRVEKPLELAHWLLKDDQNWSQSALVEALEGPPEKAINLGEPTPVHILYWTAWVDPEGKLNLRDDVYQRDKRVLDALSLSAPTPVSNKIQ